MRNQSYSFSGDGRELIIHTPQLPRSWCNYISGENYGIKFSQTGGGFSIYPILEGRRLTKYGDNDQSGRYVYFKDHSDSEYWSLNWQPVKKDMDFYECRHGQGYSIIKSRYREIEHSLRVFAADDAPVELWTIKVKIFPAANARFPFILMSNGSWEAVRLSGIILSGTQGQSSIRTKD
jgi:cellobiose phosphorylase